MMYDPHPVAMDFVHWAVINIPTATTGFTEQASMISMPAGCKELMSDWGTTGYGGPAPPPGDSHPYKFILYALDVSTLPLNGSVSYSAFGQAINGHVIQQVEITGYYP